jgi:hypothetical protein
MTTPTYDPDEVVYVAQPTPALDALWAKLDTLHNRLDALRAGRGNPGDSQQGLEREIEEIGDRCREIATRQMNEALA